MALVSDVKFRPFVEAYAKDEQASRPPARPTVRSCVRVCVCVRVRCASPRARVFACACLCLSVSVSVSVSVCIMRARMCVHVLACVLARACVSMYYAYLCIKRACASFVHVHRACMRACASFVCACLCIVRACVRAHPSRARTAALFPRLRGGVLAAARRRRACRGTARRKPSRAEERSGLQEAAAQPERRGVAAGATCNMPTCSVQRANTQHATCNMPTCSVQHATC